MRKTIAIIASLDTKGVEVAFAKELIAQWGLNTLLIDVGVRRNPEIDPDVTSQDVLASCGLTWDQIAHIEKRKRIELMSKAIAQKIVDLYENKEFDAVFSMGGIQNTLMAASAMKMLPVGIPKLILSTMASGQRLFGPFIGTKDIAIMHSVADISGINMITKSVISTAIAAIAGMTAHGLGPIIKPENTVVGATMLGVTSGSVTAAAQAMQNSGFETVSFHATGVGGSAMEDFIAQGVIRATLDMTLHEITSEVLGGYCSGASGRLLAAAKAGIPQVIVPGAVDMISCCTDFGTDSFPSDWQTRKQVLHNSSLIHLKVLRAEIIKIAEVIAERLNQCTGPATVLIPLRGFCEASAPGKALHDPEVDQAFITSLKSRIDPKIKWIEADLNISQPELGKLAATELLRYLA
ncbi:MAG: hypothetical protein H6R17_1316 [Proteobacteria bacterium]|nr:hypothetical protein [Pseudomonadota bacterium]